MPYSFDDALRSTMAANLAAFDHRTIDTEGLRHAAVALTITQDPDGDEATMLLTRRTTKLRKHAGQWALPGGRIDDGETPYEAARREMHEEVNLDLNDSHFLGRLDDLQSRSGFVISPFVFWADDLSAMRANPDEVASIHHWPVGFFEEENAIQLIDLDGVDQPLLRLNWRDTMIHAPTGAFMLQMWEVAVHGREARVDHYAHPDFTKR